MDLEYREGIACMNLGLVLFLLRFFCLLGYPHHFRFTYFYVSYDVLARVATLQSNRPSLLHTWAPPGGDIRVARLCRFDI